MAEDNTTVDAPFGWGKRSTRKYFHFKGFRRFWYEHLAHQIFVEADEYGSHNSQIAVVKTKDKLKTAVDYTAYASIVAAIITQQVEPLFAAAPAALRKIWYALTSEKRLEAEIAAMREKFVFTGAAVPKPDDTIAAANQARKQARATPANGIQNPAPINGENGYMGLDEKEGRFADTEWLEDLKGLSYKLIPNTEEVFDKMEILEMEKIILLCKGAGVGHPLGNDAEDIKLTVEMLESDVVETILSYVKNLNKDDRAKLHDYRCSMEAIEIDDKFSRLQLKEWNGLCRIYYDAAMEQEQKFLAIKDDATQAPLAEELRKRTTGLFNAVDLLFAVGRKFTGVNTWNTDEPLVAANEKALSLPRFWYDIYETKVLRTIKNDSSPAVEEYKILKNSDEKYRHRNARKLHRQAKELQQESREFRDKKYETVNALRTGFLVLTELEDLRVSLTPKEDAFIIAKINQTMNTMVNNCECFGYGQGFKVKQIIDGKEEFVEKDMARILRLAQYGANKLHVELGEKYKTPEEFWGDEFGELVWCKWAENAAKEPEFSAVERITGRALFNEVKKILKPFNDRFAQNDPFAGLNAKELNCSNRMTGRDNQPPKMVRA
ncbi:MAG: hypothetical protein FWE53_02540 [Firmicutes bacterium]|nr:hypothetical protein [Bacillota bacterium]